jgi:hypothetical protein
MFKILLFSFSGINVVCLNTVIIFGQLQFLFQGLFAYVQLVNAMFVYFIVYALKENKSFIKQLRL